MGSLDVSWVSFCTEEITISSKSVGFPIAPTGQPVPGKMDLKRKMLQPRYRHTQGPKKTKPVRSCCPLASWVIPLPLCTSPMTDNCLGPVRGVEGPVFYWSNDLLALKKGILSVFLAFSLWEDQQRRALVAQKDAQRKTDACYPWELQP